MQNFHGKTLISRDLLLPSIAHSPNRAFSNDLKGVVMKNFPGGKPPDPRASSLRSLLVSAPPQYEFRSDGPVSYIWTNDAI